MTCLGDAINYPAMCTIIRDKRRGEKKCVVLSPRDPWRPIEKAGYFN